EMRPSLAPKTAARNHPILPLWCTSLPCAGPGRSGKDLSSAGVAATRGHRDARRHVGEGDAALRTLRERVVPLALVAPEQNAHHGEIEKEHGTSDRDLELAVEMLVGPAQEHDLRDAESHADRGEEETFAALHAADRGSLAYEFRSHIEGGADLCDSGAHGRSHARFRGPCSGVGRLMIDRMRVVRSGGIAEVFSGPAEALLVALACLLGFGLAVTRRCRRLHGIDERARHGRDLLDGTVE